jgi:branched-chain amino acid transport system substrate-binding protein
MGCRAGILAALVAAAVPGLARAEITIAVVGPMTGQYAAVGEQLRRGAEMATAEINERGGILGQKVRLEIGDDVCDPKQAVSVANQLGNKGVAFVAGHYCSGSSIPASDVYAEFDIVQITPASTNPKLTERGLKNVFRVCGRDDQQGRVAGAYIAENFKDKRVALIHDKTAYGKGLADETRANLNGHGLREVMYEAITAGERDYSALVSRLKAERVDVVYFGGYHTEAGLITRQMRQAGLDAPMISGDAMVTQEFWAITGESGEGSMMTFSPDLRLVPEAAPVVERFRKTGYEPEGYTLYTYVAVQIFAQAAELAKSIEQPAVSKALRENEFSTAIGRFGFDEKGDVEGKTYAFYRWSKGDYKPM